MIRMKSLRLQQKISQLEVSRRAAIAPGTISQAESGRFVPYDSQLIKIASALGYTGEPTTLLEEVGQL
jgi:transcriptional regulator with XRE-family HTH domain